MQILLLEDEQMAGEKLLKLILKVRPSANIIWKRSMRDGRITLVEKNDLDLIFSDIELLDGNVFTLFSKYPPTVPIIFCTAYDTFYQDAFQTNGIAYINKPYREQAFMTAWNKFLDLTASGQNIILKEKSFRSMASQLSDNQVKYKQYLTVKKREGIIILKVTDINYFQAYGDYVLAFNQKGNKFVINHSLKEIQSQIDPSLFFRINRSEIVNFTCIEKYGTHIKNRLVVHIQGTKTLLYTSNSKANSFKTWIATH